MASEPYLGGVFLFAGNFAPRGYMLCAGQLLPISQYSALFAILGTTYGGNGVQTFALPDLRGRVPVGAGQGPGLGDISLGEAAGVQSVTILTSNLPPHNHLINVNSGAGSQPGPSNNFLATTNDPSTGTPYPTYEATANGSILNPQAVSVVGSGIPLSTQDPYLGINYIIAVEGIFPSRN